MYQREDASTAFLVHRIVISRNGLVGCDWAQEYRADIIHRLTIITMPSRSTDRPVRVVIHKKAHTASAYASTCSGLSVRSQRSQRERRGIIEDFGINSEVQDVLNIC